MWGVLRTPSRWDISLAVLLTAANEAELFTSYAFERMPHRDSPAPTHLVVPVLLGILLVWRRVLPLLVGPAAALVLVVEAQTVGFPNNYLPIAVVIVFAFAVGAYAPSVNAAATSGALMSALGYVHGLGDPEDPIGSAVTEVVFTVVVVFIGLVVRRQRLRADAMARRAEEIAGFERARIARELHDVVAHGMSIVVLQARGGRHKVDRDPEAAIGAFEDIERVAADCLDEMRRLLGILRQAEPAEAPLAPQPRIAELDALVAKLCDSGAVVELSVSGDRRDLPAAFELSVFRIAQEALTNALKHAPGAAADVRIAYLDDAVTIDVIDDGPGGDPRGPGHGIIGMRERAELFGGTLSAGRGSRSGFVVRARLPLPESVST